VGCPQLRNEAYTPGKVRQQLADNAIDFFSRSQNFQADAQRGTLSVSLILNWFGSDFGGTQVEQLNFLQLYLPETARRVATNPRTKVKYLDYDWSLNDQARRRRNIPSYFFDPLRNPASLRVLGLAILFLFTFPPRLSFPSSSKSPPRA